MISKVLSSIYSWIVIVVLVIVVITANSFYVVSTLNDLSALEARLFTTNRVINAINRLHVAVLRVESGQRGYMLTDDEKYLTDYSESLSVIGRKADGSMRDALSLLDQSISYCGETLIIKELLML